MSKPHPLQPSHTYHIFARGNNRENIFFEEHNYLYFLKLYDQHIAAIADTYAFCLMRNHFHMLVRIKTGEEIEKTLGVSETPRVLNSPSQRFSNFLNAYAKGINKAYRRTGSLFQHPFGRIEVSSIDYYLRLVSYIHHNPQKHGFVDDFRNWPYSSYGVCLSPKPTKIKKDTVLNWFGGPAGFEDFHRQEIAEKDVINLIDED